MWLTKKIIPVVFFYISLNGYSHESSPAVRGATFNFKEQKFSIVGDASPYHPAVASDIPLAKSAQILSPLYSTSKMDFYIPAKGFAAIRFDHEKKSLDFIMPQVEPPFSQTVLDAIDKAPDWMANDLVNLFSLLTPAYREKWAQTILEAVDPYIDEIAFCIAHLSPQYLMSPFAYPQLLIDNARLIYDNDKRLDYVEVVDFGSSASDPGYYSTTRYRKARIIDTTEVVVPRDIYYWYIVHPKISDEIPAFIDPGIVEDNYTHRNNIVSPERGYFWRDFLFYHADPGYAKLVDLLKGVKIVWNEFNGSVGSRPHAMNVLNRWQSSCMEFTSNEERPHQPVRIYRKHIGRCGENGDMRVAAARAALIPACSVASYSTDHVWNEFWEGKWIHWDGAINSPFMYVDSWGKKFGSVFRWKSDGSLIPVTDRYAREYATLNVYALDKERRPIDGARIVLYTTGLNGDLWFDMYGVTDSEGKATFLVGVDRSYYARMTCDLGSVPQKSGDLQRLIGRSRADEVYTVSMTVDALKDEIVWPQGKENESAPETLFAELDFTVPHQIVRGRDLFDDLDQNAFQFIKKRPGRVNFIIMDEENFNRYKNGETFEGWNSLAKVDSSGTGFQMDGASDFYFVFDNSNLNHTIQHITGTAALYAAYDPDIESVAVLQSRPNPFNPANGGAAISFQLPQKTKVEASIYNVLGQKVKTLLNDMRYAGVYNVYWDGKNNKDQLAPSGVYLCMIKTAEGMSFRRIILIH